MTRNEKILSECLEIAVKAIRKMAVLSFGGNILSIAEKTMKEIADLTKNLEINK